MPKTDMRFIAETFEQDITSLYGEALFAELYDIAFSWDMADEISSLTTVWDNLLAVPPSSICEVGAGTGRFTIPLIQCGYLCTAVEPDPHMAAILLRKHRSLPSNVSSRLNVLQTYYELIRADGKFDTIIAMTDTFSYIWPLERARRFIKTAYRTLSRDGVLILDVGLWRKQDDATRRNEAWKVEFTNGHVIASCKADLVELTEDIDFLARLMRVENLSFDGQFNKTKVYVSRERVIHLFSLASIKKLYEEAGFEARLCVIPGEKSVITDGDNYPRLLIAFCKAH